ncbi:MAG: spermidine synthase, partial [Bryobacteraceae bacterium]
FFQMLLLGGYGYAHWSIRRLNPRTQAFVHLALLASSLAMLPLSLRAALKPEGSEDPTWRILLLLGSTIGLPYFLLSTTGPLLQAWFARDPRMQGRTPYRLYALSNIGSMLALVSYPVAVEPFLPGGEQARVWSAGYALFLILCGVAAWRSAGADSAGPMPDESAAPAPTLGAMFSWTALAACASSLLLAVTNHLSQNVAAIPFLWILPLALYLLSFILCFDSQGWYMRKWFLLLFAVSLGTMAYAMAADSENMPLKLAVPLFATGLFTCCMVCHGELALRKPDPRHLTSFFLMVSLGGALGGVFVGIVAPKVFPAYSELPVSLAGVAALVLILLHRDPSSGLHGRGNLRWAGSAILVQTLCLYLLYVMDDYMHNSHVAVRNFYGGLRVSDWEGLRVLTHGTINHGQQYLAADRRRQPTTYYGAQAGAGLAITAKQPAGPQHVGVIGLGTGTLAVYGRPGDTYHFYEINPLVVDIAEKQFSYLRDCQAKLHVVLGDARLSLERQAAQDFDILVVDAFSSDSIPVHLLTEEAFRVYFRHLKPDGVLAVHVSNKFLNLKPVVALAAEAIAKHARLVDTDDDENDTAVYGATWVLLTADARFFEHASIQPVAFALNKAAPGLRRWTDDYSNLFRILK